jgi:hypothetical protein
MRRWVKAASGLIGAAGAAALASAAMATVALGHGLSAGAPAAHAADGRGPAQHFHSEPWLRPPAMRFTSDPDTSSGDIFVTPNHSRQPGPMILNAQGQLVWFDPVHATGSLAAFNLQVQRYQGRPVLTWWRGTVPGSPAEDLIMDRSYRTVAIVRAAYGYSTDEHEFLLTPGGRAFITAFHPVQADLSSLGGPSNGTVLDYAIQEIDVRTGRLLWDWDAMGHVPLSDSYLRPSGSSWYDYFHANSIQQLPNGNLIVSARNTSAVYEISRRTGAVIWTLGGKHSSFHIKWKARFAWQHDAHLHNGQLSLFDDAFAGGGRQEQSQSSAKLLKVNQRTMTVSLISRYTHSPPLLTGLEGSMQRLGNHDVFVGWGGEPDFSEYTPDGRQIFNGSFPLGVDSYRALRFPWSGHPLTRPSLALRPRGGGVVELWASWNGATDVAAWRVRGGPNPRALRGLGVTRRAGFETAIRLSSQPRYLAVLALDSGGHVLRSSRAQVVPRHLNIFGSEAFVSASTGAGAVPVGCFTGRACHVRVRVLAHGAVVAHAPSEKLGRGRGKLVPFQLSSAGLDELNGASGHRLAVDVRVRDSSGIQARRKIVLIPVSTSGAGPSRSLHQSPAIQIVGTTQFVSSSGNGGILAACYALTPCRVLATVSSHGAPIATSQAEELGVDELGYVPFQLTAAGQTLLDQAPGNQLAAKITLTTHRRTATGQIALARYQ